LLRKKREVVEERRQVVREEPRQERERELKPFDQFFLSTYYSHQYGFPEKDYDSPSDILNQGLYYNSGYKYYPNARRVRVYGQGFAGDRFGFNVSPFSIIVPTRHRRFNNRNNRFQRHYGPRYYRNSFNRRGCNSYKR
jgi:hypothetical protein